MASKKPGRMARAVASSTTRLAPMIPPYADTLSPSSASRNASARSTTLARPHGLPCLTIVTVGVLKSLAMLQAASRSSRLLKERSLPAIWRAPLMLPSVCSGSA